MRKSHPSRNRPSAAARAAPHLGPALVEVRRGGAPPKLESVSREIEVINGQRVITTRLQSGEVFRQGIDE